MNRRLSAVLVVIMAAGYSSFSCGEKSVAPEKAVAEKILQQLDSFQYACNQLGEKVTAGNSPNKAQQLQQLFLQVRLVYKKIEWAAEYFLPATARSVNGPPVQEVERSGLVIEPAGLQVMEGLLFQQYDTSNKTKLIKQLNIVHHACRQYSLYFKNIDILDWQIWDAAKLEMFRIETMGITGFDDPLTLQCLPESASAIEGVRQILSAYSPATQETELLHSFSVAKTYLNNHTDFNLFDRAEFITGFANPVTVALANAEKKLSIRITRYNRLLNQDAATLFDSNAYNVNAYAPNQSAFLSPEKIALGKKLFSDPMLSQNDVRSCASCHRPDKAFTDGLVKNTILGQRSVLPRNTPTLINAALQPSQFYDGRVNTLEDQSNSVVQNEKEMHGSLEISIHRLWNDITYRKLFAVAFPRPDRSSIDTLEVMNALGSYIRSLTFLNSPFDRYMRGDQHALKTSEVDGFNLFMGKAKCATCHYLPLFNGTPPPRYMKMETEVIGVPASPDGRSIDKDSGRYAVMHNPSFLHAFKTPTLRNAARTAPYMHNGVYPTLQQVLDFYNNGGGAGMGLPVNNQTLSPDSLHLSQAEQQHIIAFIRSLDSRP